MKFNVALLIVMLLAGCDKTSPDQNQTIQDTKYKVGQVWNYHTREGEEGSQIIIVRAEPSEELGTIYHIFVNGLTIQNPHTDNGMQENLPHSPVSEKTLDESVTTLAVEYTDDLPDISAGYSTWKEAFDAGEGGIFTIPINQIIQYIEDIVTGNANEG